MDDLRYELDQYQSGLSARPHIIVANKLDLPMAEKNLKELEERIQGSSSLILPVSAKKRTNTDRLISTIRDFYDDLSPETQQ